MGNKTVQISINKFREKRRFSGEDFFKDNKVFNEMKTKQNIYRARVIVQNHIDTYNDKSFDVGQEDIQDLKKGIGEFEIAISKAIQLYEHTIEITEEELIELIDNLFSFYNEFEKLITKKTFR
ncbi:hypothetical protein AS52_03674 [Priestia megaterium Q3]|uniref:Uncharacterized protein n=1 Tax=Priestia megaterium Q3 TaxID=1452722 RepID=A0A806UBU1_PRIMG|nr:hypothetical protein [Priestia megaterium]AKP78635.1 hypothetical protein AS52_03674 [Priestia megaterium Q3]